MTIRTSTSHHGGHGVGASSKLTTITNGTKLLGIEFAPFWIPMERRLQTLAAFHYVSMFLLFPIFVVILPVYLIACSQYWWLVILYACWFVYDRQTPRRGARPQKGFREWRLWNYFRDYFPISMTKTADLDPSRNYLVGYHPHGLVSIGAFVNFGTEANGFGKYFPGLTPYICTLVGQFWFPFRREYTMWFGAIEVSRESIEWQLSQPKKGRFIVIVVGGAQEALDARPGSFNIILSNRKGFVKIAITHGADLVPVFSFGENDLFTQVDNRKVSWLRKVQLAAKTILGYTPALFHGRGIFNYTFGILPYRTPIDTVVGKPIRVEQCDNPTREQVAAVHQQYVQGLIDVFEEHKSRFGVPDETHLNIY